jgi:hypothetical protein
VNKILGQMEQDDGVYIKKGEIRIIKMESQRD